MTRAKAGNGEVKQLQGALDDLIAVTALPQLWSGGEPADIASALLDSIVPMLGLQFAYACLDASPGVPAVQLICCDSPYEEGARALAARLVGRWREGKAPSGLTKSPNPFAPGDLALALVPLGQAHHVGVLVAASTHASFPGPIAALLLQVACNQASVGLLEARRVAEHKRAAEILEERVAERTAELAAANESLASRMAERKYADGELNKIAALVENSDDFIGIATLAGDIVFLNAAGRGLVGIARDRALTGFHVTDFVSGEELVRVRHAIWPSVLRHGRWEGEVCFRHFDTHEPIEMHQHVFVIRDPDSTAPLAVATVSRDITQRKRAQAEMVALKDELSVELSEMRRLHTVSMQLFATRELHEALDDLLGATMALQDAQFGLVQIYNPGTGALDIVAHRGFGPEAMELMRAMHGEGLVCSRAFRAGARVMVQDVAQDVALAPYLAGALAAGFRAVQSTPLVSRSGVPLGVVTTHFREPHLSTEQQLRFTDLYARQAADMFERDEVEAALVKAREDLAHVARITTMGELTASIAHEVNQPLAAIVTNAHACVHWLSGKPPNMPEAQLAAQRIIRDANRASDVIAHIREFVMRGKPERSPVRIEDLIIEVVDLVNGEARANAVTMSVSVEAGLHPVLADRVQLQQVLLNLVVNGIEAMATTTGRARAIHIAAQPQYRRQIRVSVRDTGPGVDSRDIDHVFDMFFTTKPKGMGMGLAMSRSIIESHGGHLWSEPAPGGGEVFAFTLPVAERAAP
jgi:PAS domain S-box-containing protein